MLLEVLDLDFKHRLLANGKERLGNNFGKGLEPGAKATGEDDCFHVVNSEKLKI
jgi:hypothetical protein